MSLPPTKVLYEHIKCQECRKRAIYWMDGIGYCDLHISLVPDFLKGMIRKIVYEVTR